MGDWRVLLERTKPSRAEIKAVERAAEQMNLYIEWARRRKLNRRKCGSKEERRAFDKRTLKSHPRAGGAVLDAVCKGDVIRWSRLADCAIDLAREMRPELHSKEDPKHENDSRSTSRRRPLADMGVSPRSGRD